MGLGDGVTRMVLHFFAMLECIEVILELDTISSAINLLVQDAVISKKPGCGILDTLGQVVE